MTERSFTFDGRTIPFRAGQSIAAALTDAGQRALRETAKGGTRGIFCGMGVCQDCLVSIDDVPNKRACMTPARAGLAVRTQVAFASLKTSRADDAGAAARTLIPDVLIVGGGAGGLSAAIAARKAGASVVVLDERKVPGGQYFKQSASAEPLDAQQRAGRDLLEAARASGAEILDSTEIWGAFDGPLFLAERNGQALIARPAAVIVATGAYERPVMVPGWTLPGVMTTGAAQTLWRSYRTLAGKRVAVCGSGPLNVQVALELAVGGAEVCAVAERAPAPFLKPLSGLRAALADPGLTLKGLGMLRQLRRAGIAMHYRTSLRRIETEGNALSVHLRAPDGAEIRYSADAVLMNAGFEPQNEILRLLGAKMSYDARFAQLRCHRSDTLETTVPGVFAVGDCAGMGGAPAAMVEGRIAGRAAAAQSGFGQADDLFADQRTLRRHRAFQSALWRLHDVSAQSHAETPPDTLLCRCEEISFEQALAGLDAEPGHLGTLKRATRVGMGRCQGRYCGPVAARLVAEAIGREMTDHSYFAPRVPIKPVSISAILAAQEALDGQD